MLFSALVNPAVGLEPAQRFDDALFDRELGFPAGCLDFFRVEKDEWIVTDPALVAAGVFELRFQAERGAKVAYALVDLNVFGRAEVVYLRVVLGVFRRGLPGDVQHGVDAVLHVEVALALGAIAKYA